MSPNCEPRNANATITIILSRIGCTLVDPGREMWRAEAWSKWSGQRAVRPAGEAFAPRARHPRPIGPPVHRQYRRLSVHDSGRGDAVAALTLGDVHGAVGGVEELVEVGYQVGRPKPADVQALGLPPEREVVAHEPVGSAGGRQDGGMDGLMASPCGNVGAAAQDCILTSRLCRKPGAFPRQAAPRSAARHVTWSWRARPGTRQRAEVGCGAAPAPHPRPAGLSS